MTQHLSISERKAAEALGFDPEKLSFFPDGGMSTTFSTIEKDPRREVIYKTILETYPTDEPHPWRCDIAFEREIETLDLLERKAQNWPVNLPQMLYLYPDRKTYVQRKFYGERGYGFASMPVEKIAKDLAEFVVLFDDIITTNATEKFPVFLPFAKDKIKPFQKEDFALPTSFDLSEKAWKRAREKIESGNFALWNFHGDLWPSNTIYDPIRKKITVIDLGSTLASCLEFQAVQFTLSMRKNAIAFVPLFAKEIAKLTGKIIDRDIYAVCLSRTITQRMSGTTLPYTPTH